MEEDAHVIKVYGPSSLSPSPSLKHQALFFMVTSRVSPFSLDSRFKFMSPCVTIQFPRRICRARKNLYFPESVDLTFTCVQLHSMDARRGSTPATICVFHFHRNTSLCASDFISPSFRTRDFSPVRGFEDSKRLQDLESGQEIGNRRLPETPVT